MIQGASMREALSPPPWLLHDDSAQYRIFVAATTLHRVRAYRLAAELYRQAGLAHPDSVALAVHPYDAWPQTLALLAEDEAGRDAATMTLVCDGQQGLPADAVFGDELRGLRRQGRRLAEGVRLAIRPEHLFSEHLFRGMLALLYLYGTRVRAATDLIVEINPRHVAYYRRLFGFQLLGPERPCPRVQGAPARLLVLTSPAPEASAHPAHSPGPITQSVPWACPFVRPR